MMHNIHCFDDTHVHVGFAIMLCGEHNQHEHAHTHANLQQLSPPHTRTHTHKASTQFSYVCATAFITRRDRRIFGTVFDFFQSSFSRVFVCYATTDMGVNHVQACAINFFFHLADIIR